MSGSGTGTKATTEGTFTYNPADLTTELNKLRLLLGDTDSTEPLLYDEEIAEVQDNEDNFYSRAAECCLRICGKTARDTKVKLEGYSEGLDVIYERYLKMSERFSRLASSSYPWAGSIRDAYKKSNEEDDAVVKPNFKKGQFNHP